MEKREFRRIVTPYSRILAKHIKPRLHHSYRKWLLFYLDYCFKYSRDTRSRSTLPHFLEKLRSKKCTLMECEQAAHAVELLFIMREAKPGEKPLRKEHCAAG